MLNARYRQFSFSPKCAEWDYNEINYDEENYFNVDNENHNNAEVDLTSKRTSHPRGGMMYYHSSEIWDV